MHISEVNAERIEGLPDEAYWQMVDASIELRRQEASAAKAYHLGLQQAKKEYIDRFNSIVGSKSLPKYLAARKEYVETIRAAREKAKPTREGRDELAKLQRRLAEQSKSFIRELGLDVAQIRRLRKDHRATMAALFDATVGKRQIGEGNKKVKNTTFTPPYNGGSAFVSILLFQGDPTDILPVPSFSIFVNHKTGEVGDSTASSLTDASDFDMAFIICLTAMRRWFQMPSDGQVVVSSTLEVVNASHSGSIVDEWGVSDIDLRQNWNTITRVTSPTVSPTVIMDPITNNFDYHDTNEDDHTWSKQWMQTGSQYGGFTTTIPGVFSKGTWVLVDVGVQSVNTFWSNDCSVISDQTTRFLTRKIGLSSTGP
jgi:hypothetical protein